MVARYRAGDVAGALAVRDQLRDELGWLITQASVDGGAYDGETYSNTSCLADLGWRGVYIEPVPEAAAKCRARHAASRAVSVIDCAIGAADGTTRLWQNGPCSTTSPEAHAMHVRQ